MVYNDVGFLFSLVNLGGLVLLATAVWMGGSKD